MRSELRRRTSTESQRRSAQPSSTTLASTLPTPHSARLPEEEEDGDHVNVSALSVIDTRDAAGDAEMLLGNPATGKKSPTFSKQTADAKRRRRNIALGVAACVVLLWLISSRESAAVVRQITTSSPSAAAAPPPPTNLSADDYRDLAMPPPPVDLTACLPVPGKPEHQYGLMIDAGSTGSRIHIYDFRFCADPNDPTNSLVMPTLANEGFHQRQGGLSSFRGKPREAAESLRTLMDEAVRAVPKTEHHCTPLAVKATAGLRLLGPTESDAILRAVRAWLQTEYEFPVVAGEEGVGVMEGRDEGVYAWITINYLLGLIGPRSVQGQSAAVMDLGGASTQIVFEPSFPDHGQLSPGDHVYDLSFSQKQHVLYQHSHLGFGLMQARRAVHNLVAFTWMWQQRNPIVDWADLTESIDVPHPCLVRGGRKVVELDPPGRPTAKVTLVGTGAGFDACRRVVDVIMAKDALCKVEPCAFGGVYQPDLMQTFGSGPIYALSYFYDRIVPLGVGRDSKPFTLGELRTLAYDVCLGPEPPSRPRPPDGVSGWSRFRNSREAMDELKDRPEYCLDLTFMYSLLSLGYELGDERFLVTGKQLQGIELGWALGAGLAMLEGDLSCRADR